MTGLRPGMTVTVTTSMVAQPVAITPDGVEPYSYGNRILYALHHSDSGEPSGAACLCNECAAKDGMISKYRGKLADRYARLKPDRTWDLRIVSDVYQTGWHCCECRKYSKHNTTYSDERKA